MDEDDKAIAAAAVAEYRSLEPLCAVASSPSARSVKANLRAHPVLNQVNDFALFCIHDFPNLARCALAVGLSADSDWSNGHDSCPLLCVAAKCGSARVLKLLLDAGANVHLGTRIDNATALHEAAFEGHSECVRMLLKARAPIEARSAGRNCTPLLFAAAHGHAEVCALLLQAGASFRARNNNDDNALNFSVASGVPEVITMILDAGEDIEGRNTNEQTPLHTAAFNGQVLSIECLLARGTDPNAIEHDGLSPLMCAIAQQRPLAVSALLPVSDLGIHDAEGRSALHLSAVVGARECFDLLRPHFPILDAGTLVNANADDPAACPQPYCATCHFNHTALHLAIRYGNLHMVQRLLRLGASRTALDTVGHTPLHFAAFVGHLSSVTALLGRPGAFMMSPAQVNMADDVGCTALHEAARHGRLNVCGALIQAGARLDLTTSDGETPLALAQQEHPDHHALLQLLAGNAAAPLPGTVCERCAAVPDSQLMHCDGCQAVRYCCPRCAAADWPRHVAACEAWWKEWEEWKSFQG